MNLLKLGQLIVAILLMVVILLQSKGSGLSGVFGGSGNVFMTKRGFEKKLFVATIVLAVLFFIISLANFI